MQNAAVTRCVLDRFVAFSRDSRNNASNQPRVIATVKDHVWLLHAPSASSALRPPEGPRLCNKWLQWPTRQAKDLEFNGNSSPITATGNSGNLAALD